MSQSQIILLVLAVVGVAFGIGVMFIGRRTKPAPRTTIAQERATTTVDDVWYKPYDHTGPGEYEKQARDYLSWEVALVDQIARDPTIRFRTYD